jgi:hypothetical protein
MRMLHIQMLTATFCKSRAIIYDRSYSTVPPTFVFFLSSLGRELLLFLQAGVMMNGL